MSEITSNVELLPRTVTVCGRPGKLTPIAEPATRAAPNRNLVGADGCWVWRTDEGFLRTAEPPPQSSLLTLACDVAELYHQHCTLQLSDLPGPALEVIWLELAADNALLVFLKPVVPTVQS